MQLFINTILKCYFLWRRGVRLRGHDNRNFSWIMGCFELWRNKHVSVQAAGGGSEPPSSSNNNPFPIMPRGMEIHSSEQLLLQSKCLISECERLSFWMRICFAYAWKVDFTLHACLPERWSVVAGLQPLLGGRLKRCSQVLYLGWIEVWSDRGSEMTRKTKL